MGKYVNIHRFSICVYDDLKKFGKIMGIAFSDYFELSIAVEVGEMRSACMIARS